MAERLHAGERLSGQHLAQRLVRAPRVEFDRYRRDVATRGRSLGGLPQERAYHDTLRDLAAPAMGLPPVIRTPVFDEDGAGVYERYRECCAPSSAPDELLDPRR